MPCRVGAYLGTDRGRDSERVRTHCLATIPEELDVVIAVAGAAALLL